MAQVNYDQSNFTFGELDPKVQKRTDYEGYYKGLKYARNILCIPQGGFQSRWGTTYTDELTVVDVERPLEAELAALVYDDETIYTLVWEALTLNIYLENTLSATIATPFEAEDINNLRPIQIENRLIIAWGRGAPRQLLRAADAANAIVGFDSTNNYLTITNALTIGNVYAAKFTTSGTLPVTNPALYANVTYYVVPITTTSIRIYTSAQDAKADINYYTVTSAGTGTNNLFIQNTWTIPAITFKFIPAYDFDGGYSALTFTPSATSGSITLTASGSIFTPAMIGGLYSGGGGIMRITGFTNATLVSGYTVEDFNSTSAILGTLSFLGEPAWSDARGWPALSSAYQNRLVFARTRSIVNGRWLSVINNVFDFDDSLKLDDDAISWYPFGSGVGYIQALTSARTLIVHTNTNTQSTPVLNELPITPTNCSFPEQSKFGALPIQPIFLDNQIIFVDKGNNVINMIWDIAQSAFNTQSISVPSSSLIRTPVDMAAYAQPVATDGFYALFVNSDGTMASFQSLIEQNVRGWTLMNTKNQFPIDQSSNGIDVDNEFIRVVTALSRCWLLVRRRVMSIASTTAIVNYSSAANTLTSVAHGIGIGEVSQVAFTTIGTLPSTSPTLNTTGVWFARGITVDTFAVFTNKADAEANTNRLLINNAGVNSSLVRYESVKKMYLEELSFDVRTDSTVTKSYASPTTAITGLDHLEGCVVKVVADGYVLTNKTVLNGAITLEIAASEVLVGTQFIAKAVPLPVSVPGIMGTLYTPTHIRAFYVAYVQSEGLTIQGTGIPVINMQDFVVGEIPEPRDGVFLFTPMEGWDGFTYDLEIVQANPLPMIITGLSYKMEL